MLRIAMGAAGSLAAAKGMADYMLEKQVPDGAMRVADYYGREEGAEAAIAAGQGAAPKMCEDLVPELAEALGLKAGQAVDVEALTFILAGKRADGSDLPVHEAQRNVTKYEPADGEGHVRHRVAYIDGVFSAPKDVSIAWSFEKIPARQAAIHQAHRTAVDQALRYIEARMIRARIGAQGKGGFERGRAAWLEVNHYTARPTQETTRVDPETGEIITLIESMKVTGSMQLHTHALIPNVILTESGRLAAIDATALHGRIHEAGAVYQAVLGRELRALGIHVEADPDKHTVRLPAIPEHVIDEFSPRRAATVAEARAQAKAEGLDWTTMTEAQRGAFTMVAAKTTRMSKESNTPDFAAWREQAERINWTYKSVIPDEIPADTRTKAERMTQADEVGLRHLADMLTTRAVIGQGDARLAATRGFIAAGIQDVGEIDDMVRHWAKGGVVQDGVWTKLLVREGERGSIKITTELHRDQEAELVALARRAVADRRLALDTPAVEAAVTRSGVKFTGKQGAAQLDVVRALATDGGLAVMIGVAGAGKTTNVLKPMVQAWRDAGLEVWGTTQGWKQAREMRSGGLPDNRTHALQPFLDGIRTGRLAVDARSVVVLDEIGQVGTRQLLDLLRHREAIGFKLVAMGDPMQCSSIEAGPVVDLVRLALGEDRIPQILTTIRQATEREQDIAKLFRDGNAAEALAAKRADGTAELVPGGYIDAVERIADLYAERRRATVGEADYKITISAPTNADARAIGAAVRERRRDMGELGRVEDEITLKATDGHGASYEMQIVAGDRVRLFAATRGVFTSPTGKRVSASIGDNGSVLTVARVLAQEGLVLRTEAGKEGFVSWGALRDRQGSGRLLLAHGDVLTIDSAQGITSAEHINAMPSGSKHVTGFKAYVAGSRHRIASYLIGSAGAEIREVQSRRLMGLPAMEPAEAAAEAWAVVAQNLSRQKPKDSALELLQSTAETRRLTVRAFQSSMERIEARESRGEPPLSVRETLAAKQVADVAPVIAKVVEAIGVQRQEVARVLTERAWVKVPSLAGELTDQQRALYGLPQKVLSPADALQVLQRMTERDLKLYAPVVARGLLEHHDVVDFLMERAEVFARSQHGVYEHLDTFRDGLEADMHKHIVTAVLQPAPAQKPTQATTA